MIKLMNNSPPKILFDLRAEVIAAHFVEGEDSDKNVKIKSPLAYGNNSLIAERKDTINKPKAK